MLLRLAFILGPALRRLIIIECTWALIAVLLPLLRLLGPLLLRRSLLLRTLLRLTLLLRRSLLLRTLLRLPLRHTLLGLALLRLALLRLYRRLLVLGPLLVRSGCLLLRLFLLPWVR